MTKIQKIKHVSLISNFKKVCQEHDQLTGSQPMYYELIITISISNQPYSLYKNALESLKRHAVFSNFLHISELF